MTNTDPGLDDSGLGDTQAATVTGGDGERIDRDPVHWDRGVEIARGGMGRVIEARDRRLDRTVAIKELLTHDPGQITRFEREARLAARLQHPAIVPVYEAGRSPAGEPYLVMKKVDGRDLERVIDETRTLGERMALLPSVLAVADAMAYAHARGVIHRDLKPRNVLIGEFGETVVIDWGLAKELGDADAREHPARAVAGAGETVAGSVMGTPAYMPPEQAAGEPVDARADVYSLGALLYHVLAGRAPYTGEIAGDLLEQVRRTGPRPLGEVAAGVPVDLLAIVHKAMARAPAERYASASELALDLRRFGTGQLVGVHRYTAAQLLRRWLRRHRIAVGVGGVAAVLLLAGGALSVRRILREQHHAEAERALAEQHGADADELMEFMLFELHDRLQPIGKLDLLDAPARKAVAYYQKRPPTHGPGEARRRATALTNLGDVLRSRSDNAAALAEYRQAKTLLEAAVADQPGDAEARRALAVAHDRTGDALEGEHDLAAALVEYRAAMEIRTRLAAAAPDAVEVERDLAVGHERLGNIFADLDDGAAALAEYRAAMEIRTRLAARAPDDRRAQRDLSVAHTKLGEALEAQGDLAAALTEYRADLAIAELLAAAEPDNADGQRDLSVSLIKVGSALQKEGDLTGALAEDQAALTIRARLAALDPSNPGWQRDLAYVHDDLGALLVARGDLRAALAERRAALRGLEALAAVRADHVIEKDVANDHYQIADILLAQHQPAAALAEYRASLETLERIATRDPTDADAREDVAGVRATIASCCGPAPAP